MKASDQGYNAPADFVETANTIGLPRYAKQAVDQQFARWVMLHVQSNPLPICTRPQVLRWWWLYAVSRWVRTSGRLA